MGVVVRQHRIIYKFMEDVENFVYDARMAIAAEGGKAVHIEVVGEAQVG